MPANLVQIHGGEVYDRLGKPLDWADFSTTVASHALPPGWRGLAARRLESLRRYPQPFSTGLAAWLEQSLELPAGSLLVGNGTSECIEWLALSRPGRRAVVAMPSFGGVSQALLAGRALLKPVFGRPPKGPSVQALVAALRPGSSLWLANPSSPAGEVIPARDLARLARACAARASLLVVDETLQAQALKPVVSWVQEACRRPGCVVLRSLSKSLGLPGLRLGYLAGHVSETKDLRGFQQRWSMNSLSQALAPDLFKVERSPRGRQAGLAGRKADLVARLKPLSRHLRPVDSHTGYFLVEIRDPAWSADALSLKLQERGILVRSCSSYGAWGARFLRLNPLAGPQNRRLALGLGAIFRQARA